MLDSCLLLSFVLTFVVDALDEYESDDGLPTILRLLTELKDLKIVQAQVLTTSRLKTTIRLGFRAIPEITHHDLMLHSVPQLIVEHNISIFLRCKLLRISRKHALEKDLRKTSQARRTSKISFRKPVDRLSTLQQRVVFPANSHILKGTSLKCFR